ncbi:MAG: hypothetical protein JWP18_1444 [Solirubrobacterales bacterium]|nr:hypothetical protein [Solirubrobacterales bacterium]
MTLTHGEVEHRISYVLLVHRAPEQVIRLVRRLDGPGVRFFIHVDRTSNVQGQLTGLMQMSNVQFLRRRRVSWGGYGLPAAAIDGFRAAKAYPFDHVVVISGQDYPVKPPSQIAATLKELGERSLVEHEAMPRPAWEGGGMDRIQRFHLRTSGRFRVSLPGRRALPCGLRPYGGSSWCALSRSAVDEVLSVLDRHPEIRRFFRTTMNPDEILFQTLLMNSPLEDTLVNLASSYADWTDRGERKPAVLRAVDISELAAIPHLFARKFDEHRFPGMLNLVDRELCGLPVTGNLDFSRTTQPAHTPAPGSSGSPG